jgi:HD-like signal output (HDOD) protein
MRVGQLAKDICRSQESGKDLVANALLAGFMHDIGKLVLVQNLSSEYESVMNTAQSENADLVETEREVLGASHAEIGGYLLGLWGLNDDIVEAITFHHAPQSSKAPSFSPLTAVHVANSLIHEQSPPSIHTARIDVDYLESLNLADRLDCWRGLCKPDETDQN